MPNELHKMQLYFLVPKMPLIWSTHTHTHTIARARAQAQAVQWEMANDGRIMPWFFKQHISSTIYSPKDAMEREGWGEAAREWVRRRARNECVDLVFENVFRMCRFVWTSYKTSFALLCARLHSAWTNSILLRIRHTHPTHIQLDHGLLFARTIIDNILFYEKLLLRLKW